jgi:hypothetical protein
MSRVKPVTSSKRVRQTDERGQLLEASGEHPQIANLVGELEVAMFERRDQRLVVQTPRLDLAGIELGRRLRRHDGLAAQGIRDGADDLLFSHRLDQEPARAETTGQRDVLGGGVRPRVEDEGRVRQRRVGSRCATQREAVHLRHQNVGDDQVGRLLARACEGIEAVAGLGHRMALRLQQRAQPRAALRFIVDDQDASHRKGRRAPPCAF